MNLPEGFSASPLPVGFTDQPPPPEGFSDVNPIKPPTNEGDGQLTNVQVPGFWSTVGSAFERGLTERVADDIAGAKVVLPVGYGGETLEQQFQKGQVPPQTQDEIDSLLGKRVNDGWSDSKWWGAQIAKGTGGVVPGALSALGGAAISGGVGGVVGFGAEGGLGALVPAYKKARAEGLDPDSATTRAIVDSGISAATAVAMGLGPEVSFFGRQGVEVGGQIASMMKRPAMETLAQVGIVQPSLAITGELATALTHGETPNPWDLATTGVVGIGMGGAMVGAHAVIRTAAQARKEAIPASPPATPDAIQASFDNQNPASRNAPPPLPEGFSETPSGPPASGNPATSAPATGETLPGGFSVSPEASSPNPFTGIRQDIEKLQNSSGVQPPLEALDETLYPKEGRESRIFFSKLKQVAVEKLPENASAEQVIATLKNNGVRDEELIDTGLPSYLADVNGRVNKKDLIAHIEANGLQLEEVQSGAPISQSEALRGWEPENSTLNTPTEQHYRQPEYPTMVAPGPHSNYREMILKVPPRGDSEFPAEDFPNLNYSGSHWPDMNVIAHIRSTDRVDRNGRNLLHVEEIQSDLHQEGRKKGYKDSSIPPVDLAAQDGIYRSAMSSMEHYKKLTEQGLMSRAEFRQKFSSLQTIRDDAKAKIRAGLEEQGKLPDLPFKTSWDELAVKRILRLAADEGYDGISWANGDQVGLRQATPEQLRGSREFYDKKISSLFKKWAKKLGADTNTTRLDLDDPNDINPVHSMRLHQMGLDPAALNERNGMIEVNPAAGERIRQGLPLYDDGVKKQHSLSEAFQRGTPKTLEPMGKKIIAALGQLGKDMKISKDIHWSVAPSRATWRGKTQKSVTGDYTIQLNTNRLRTAEDLYSTAAHELGHVIMWDKFANADNVTKTLVLEDYRKFRNSIDVNSDTVGAVRGKRDNAVSEMTGGRNLLLKDGTMTNDLPLSDLMPRSKSYLLHFEEWFAEQVAKWATTSDKPLSRVEKFYKGLGDKIRAIIETFNKLRAPQSADPSFAMKSWLDSMVTDMAPFAADIKDKLEFDTKRINQNALDRDGTPEVNASPSTASTIGGRNVIDQLPPDGSSAGPAMAAHGDRMNKFFEWMTSLPQIADMNKQIRGLTLYTEIVKTMNVEKNNIMTAAWSTLDQWKKIRDPRQQVAIGKFIDDYMNGLFKDPLDTSGTIRRPTQQEFAKLVSKHGLSNESLATFNRLVQDFDQFLEGYRQLLLSDAARIKDPQVQMQKMVDINKRVDEIHSRPFMPAMRFGKYTITVYDDKGNVKHFEQAESLKKQRQIAEALAKSSDLLPGDRVRTGEVAKDAAPLLGMPPGLLDLINDKLDLSTTQRDMLDQLRFDYAPSQSFRHQFKTKDLTPGYSTDFQRAYANFFFHGANHVTRIKWVDSLRDQIREVKASSIDMNDAVKRDQIANYMTEHLKMLVDPKPDFAALRGLMFHWYLGFNPASATLNLSQTAIMTYPHLASKFGGAGIGDLRSIAALTRASSELNNFYKKGTLYEKGRTAPPGPQGSKDRALAEAIREGVISETQAHTLAAVSEGRNMLQAFGSKGEAAWNNFSNASSWMFEMTEQYNRRVAFRAAWDLAMRDPNNKYVAEQVRDNPLQYKRLLDQGWSHQEASAFTAAKDSVEKTQFVYAPYSRPKFMWGRKGALFIFKSFVQNTLFNLYNNPAMAARSLLILGGVGGLMGLPGMEDVNGILKSLAWRLFGKDFDLEDEVRKFAVDVLHGAISPDMLLHGTSVKGFGIPAVLDMMGSLVGVKHIPAPVLDRHGSIGMGNILPFEPGKLFGPSKDYKGAELQQLQKASGAGFGLGFSLYNFLTSTQDLSSLKRWEGVMPRVMNNVSHAFRFATQGKETTASGSTVVKFDVTDTEQMAEILARAGGYQPRRLTAQYERIQAQTEAATYWDLRKQILLRQFAGALKGGNPEDKASVLTSIKNYNHELPDDAKAKSISAATIRESVMNKFRTQAKVDAGIATSKQNVQMFKNMQKYYPDGPPPNLKNVSPVK